MPQMPAEDLRSFLLETTAQLCEIPGVAGFEQRVVARLLELFRPYADTVDVDAMGNVYAWLRGSANGPTMMISAHSDEIGGVVRAVEPGGFLRFNKLGGALDAMLVGRMVSVNGHFGVVGVKAGHAQTEEERSRTLDYTKLYIDVGADSPEAVAQMGIRIGDPVTYVSEIHRFSNPDRFCGKAIDNRLSCAILLALSKILAGTDLPGTLCLAVTVQEEVGLRGAQVAGYHVNPACAVVVDTIPCGDTPDDPARTLPIGIGRGPALRLVSKGDVMHPGMKRLLLDAAQEGNIPHQLVVHDRSTTDASAIHIQRDGIPTAVVNIPRRYAHTPVEVADVNDALYTVRLLEGVAARLGRLEGYLRFLG